MIQCSECEFFVAGPGGQMSFKCNPFTNIKEPECLQKWQLAKLDLMVQAYQATIQAYQRMAPLQEKMFRQMEQELDDTSEADSWKRGKDEDEEEDNYGADYLP
jgi:hypothetical protein